MWGVKTPCAQQRRRGESWACGSLKARLGDSCTPWTFEDGPDSAGCLHGSGGSQGLQPDRAQCHGISKGRERVQDSWGRSRTSVSADTVAPTTSTIRGGPCPEWGLGCPHPGPLVSLLESPDLGISRWGPESGHSRSPGTLPALCLSGFSCP